MYTEECAHLQSNTEFFFYSSHKSILYPAVSVRFFFLRNDIFFSLYKCANKTDLESFSAQCVKSPGSSGAAVELLVSTSVRPSPT